MKKIALFVLLAFISRLPPLLMPVALNLLQMQGLFRAFRSLHHPVIGADMGQDVGLVPVGGFEDCTLFGFFLRTDQVVISRAFLWRHLADPAFAVLLAHLFVFTILRCIHYVAIPYLLVLFAASSLLVSTIAVFISSSFKRISTAQITTLICIILFGSPLCCGLPTFLVSPVTIATIILGTSAGHETAVMPVSKLQLFLAKGIGPAYGLLSSNR